ncbi:MAG TPA: hypothetical protein VII82_08865 [Polyangiaceae bacterium]|jgi:hypothetical protein
MTPAPRFVLVNVDEHEALPAGCCMRFKLAGEPRPVRRVRYEAETAESSVDCVVEAPTAGAHEGSEALGVAWAVEVEDSSAGTSTLVYGGNLGLRLRPVAGGVTVAEPYLLLVHEAVLEWG